MTKRRTTRGERQAHPVHYRIWLGMIHRCENPKHSQFANYGARGIKVCKRWQTFQHFIADMGERPSPKHSVDRRNNDLGYSKHNCRWATPKEQANNKRKTLFVVYNGERVGLGALLSKVGLKQDIFERRLRKGMTVEQAVALPRMSTYEARRYYREFEKELGAKRR